MTYNTAAGWAQASGVGLQLLGWLRLHGVQELHTVKPNAHQADHLGSPLTKVAQGRLQEVPALLTEGVNVNLYKDKHHAVKNCCIFLHGSFHMHYCSHAHTIMTYHCLMAPAAKHWVWAHLHGCEGAPQWHLTTALQHMAHCHVSKDRCTSQSSISSNLLSTKWS